MRDALIHQGRFDRSALHVGLTHVELHAAGAVELAAIAALPRLRSLKVTASLVGALAPLAGHPTLAHVELAFTDAHDLSPLLELPALHSAILVGNPLDEESATGIVDRLRAAHPAIVRSRREQVELTRALWQRGARAGVGRVDGRQLLLVALRDDGAAVARVRPHEVRKLVDEPAALATRLAGAEDARAWDLTSHRTLGDAADAAGWIDAAALDEGTRARLRTLVRRFPTLAFWREDDVLLDALARDHGVRWPAWLRALRRTLAWIMPERVVQVQLERFDQPSPNERYLEDMWLDVGLRGVDDPAHQPVVDEDGFFPIAADADAGLYLAINLADGDDLRIYEYDEEDVGHDGRLTLAPRPILDSFASLLGHVVTVRVDGGDPIRAR